MVFTYLLGFLFNIVLVFYIGDPAQLLASLIEQPVAQLFYNLLGKGGGIFFTIAAFIILQFVCFIAIQALARTVFAFSRDRLIPFSSIWTRMNPVTQTPLYAVWILIDFCILITLIGLGSYAVIAGVFNICAIALNWSYCIPIARKLFFGEFQPGPWHLGKAGFLVNLWAYLWTLFVSIIFILPIYRPVTDNNMNYAVVFLLFILLCAVIYWYASGRKFYTGPVIEAEIIEIESAPLPIGGKGLATAPATKET
jgi:amino acid transporter